MKLKLYENADDFLSDNRQFIYGNSLEADLVFMNAHSKMSKQDGFYGASVKDGDNIMLAVQTGNYPRVHFSSCENHEEMTDILVGSYIDNENIPSSISGDIMSIDALVKSFKKHSVDYNLHTDMLKRRCDKLIDVPIPSIRLVNAKTVDFDFSKFYIEFAVECNLPFEKDKARDKTNKMIENDNLYALVDDGVVVSIAATARKTENGRAVNMVYTPPEYRGKGYSTCCVKQLTAKILDEYDYAYLYTDAANPISNHVYEKLGYEVFGQFRQYDLVKS